MNDDLTPINARPKRRPPEAFEDLSLALRDRLIWPVQDRFLGLGDSARTAVAGGAVVLALGIGIGGYSLASSDETEPTAPRQVAVAVEPAPAPEPVEAEPAPAPEPEPTLQGATPVFKAKGASGVGGSKAVASSSTPNAATSSQTGNAATDTISSKPSSGNASAPASASASASASTSTVKGPPAGPAGVAVARKFAQAFVVYETGGDKADVRRDFAATATSELTRALMRRPPRQPANVEVPKARVVNVVPAPSQGKVFPVSVSLLRVGATSELRLEMEKPKNEQWRVVNVLG
jgi:hypothetical protein